MTAVERVESDQALDLPVGVRPPAFALFAEMLLVGAVVSVLSLAVVTVLPALAAGIGHLRRHAGLRSDRLVTLLADFRSHLGGVWGYAIALPLVAALLLFNLLAVSTATPPGFVVRWVSLALAAVIAVVVLRAATRKAGGAPSWRTALLLGREDARSDLTGSVLLVAATGLGVVVVWMLPILILIVPGMLMLAAVAVERRRR